MAIRIKSKNMLVYLILLALFIAGAYLLNNRFGYTPLLFLLSLLPIDALCVLHARRCVHDLSSPDFRESQRGAPVEFPYTYQNSSRSLVCHLSISLRLMGPKGSRPDKSKVTLDIAPGVTETFRLSVTPRHIGVYRIQTQKIRVYGPVGLFAMKLPTERPATSVLVPSRSETVAPKAIARSGQGENAARAERRGHSADNYDGVREYAPGDPLRSIHWKLTAHHRKIMTRLYEEEKDYVTVAVDLRPVHGPAEQMLCIHDQLCESAYRAVCDRFDQGAKIRLIFFEGERLRVLWAGSETDLTEAAVGLASADPATETLADLPSVFPAAGEILIVSAHLDTALAHQLGEFTDTAGKAFFHYIAPAYFDQKDSSAYFSYLMEHDVSYVVVKAPEARQTQKEHLRVGQVSAVTGERNERVFHRQ